MPHHSFSLSAAASRRALCALGLFALLAPAAFATSFTVAANATDNAGKTLGSGASQTGSIAATGTLSVSGATVAVTVSGSSATLTNNGSILQTGTGRAIRDNTGVTGLTINNGSGSNSAAVIQTVDADVIQMNKTPASVTLNNYGTMTSLNASAGGAQVVDFNAILSGTNIVNNFSTGIMQASEADVIRPGVNGQVFNDGTIKATTTTGSSSDGIDAQTNTGIAITNAATTASGLIEGARHGITGGNTAVDANFTPTLNNGAFTMSVTNNLGGTIQGDNGSGINIDGVNANEVVTIVNHGTITGNGHDISDAAAHDGDGVDVDGVVNLTNTGTIHSLNSFGVGGAIETSEGVTVGGGTITNSGTIQGSVADGNTTAVGRGITIAGVDKYTVNGVDTAVAVQAPYAATTITNSGLIRGDTDSGIAFTSALASGFSHTITNEASGTIQGGGTGVAAIVTAADAVTINNSGKIDGSSSGKAITGGSGSLTLNVLGGSAVILGNIAGGTGAGTTNTLTFKLGSPSATFSYVGAISDFATVEVQSGKVTLAGTSSYTGATNVTGGTLFVNGSLGHSAVSVSSGALLGGSGTIGGSVIASGVIAPGNSLGTLTVSGDVTWNGSGGNAWAFELGAGSVSDALGIGGDFLKGTGTTFAFDLQGGTAVGSFVLASWGGTTTFAASDFSYTNLGSGLSGVFAIDGGQLEFTTTAVPEPATTAAILAGAMGLGAVLLRRRRR